MKAGMLKNVAAVWIPSNARTASGQVSETFTQLGQFRCSVRSTTQTDSVAPNSAVGISRYDLRFRYTDALQNISMDSYLLINSQKFHLVSPPVNVRMSSRELQFICEVRA